MGLNFSLTTQQADAFFDGPANANSDTLENPIQFKAILMRELALPEKIAAAFVDAYSLNRDAFLEELRRI